MLILPSRIFGKDKPPCIADIMAYLKQGGMSFLLYSQETTPTLHLMRELFPWYYTDNGNVPADIYIKNMYGSFIFADLFGFPSDLLDLSEYTDDKFNKLLEYVKNSINATTYIHEYELNTLLETTRFTYNPIENYSMTETEKSTTTENTGINSAYSEEQNGTTQSTIGEFVKSEERENMLPNRTEESTKQVAPYDNESFYNQEKTTSTFSASTSDRTNIDTVENEHVDNVSNTANISGSNDTKTTNTASNDRTLTRSGNIGVMSTQDMIEQERRVADFSLFKKFMELFANDNLMLVD